MFRDDYLLRQIHELSAAIERAFDHHAAGDVEAGLEELRQAMDALLGPNRSLVDTLDLASVGALLGADKMRSMARLRAAEATLHEASGDRVLIDACRREALDYWRWARGAEPQPEDDEAIARLEAQIEAGP